MSIERLLLRPIEVAEAIGCSKTKTYELLAKGDIPSIKVGNSVRVPVDALKRWIATRLLEGGTGC